MSYVIYVNWNTKQGMMHRITCYHARRHERLWDRSMLVDGYGASWWGPYDTYQVAREKADKISFNIYDCSHCKPYECYKFTISKYRLKLSSM